MIANFQNSSGTYLIRIFHLFTPLIFLTCLFVYLLLCEAFHVYFKIDFTSYGKRLNEHKGFYLAKWLHSIYNGLIQMGPCFVCFGLCIIRRTLYQMRPSKFVLYKGYSRGIFEPLKTRCNDSSAVHDFISQRWKYVFYFANEKWLFRNRTIFIALPKTQMWSFFCCI